MWFGFRRTVPCGLNYLVYRESYQGTHWSFAAALSDLSIWTNINHLKPYISCTAFVWLVRRNVCCRYVWLFFWVSQSQHNTPGHVRDNIFCDFATQHCYVMRTVEAWMRMYRHGNRFSRERYYEYDSILKDIVRI